MFSQQPEQAVRYFSRILRLEALKFINSMRKYAMRFANKLVL